jgi:putative heme-binding domain-containing protein
VRDLSTVFGDGRALDEVKRVVLDDKAEMTMREAALKTLIEARPDDLRALCESLLETRILNGTAVRGLALFDDPQIGTALAKRYRRFVPSSRPAVIDVLVSRPAWAGALLDQMKSGGIPRNDVSAFHARQIHAFKDAGLSEKLTEIWGELRESAADKQQLIAKLKASLNPAALGKADLGQGRQLFQALCGACHVLYGAGGKLGPDLTGSGRANLDYLLENIVDPSAVVSADYRVTVITLKDGRTLSGAIAAQTDRTLTLRQLTEETVLQKSDIAQQTTAPISMMPEGMLLALQPDQVRNLIAYLMHPVQVPLPGAQ